MTDTLLGIDGLPLPRDTSNPLRVPRLPAKRASAPGPTAAQAERHRALLADGHTVKLGATGSTVFSFGRS